MENENRMGLGTTSEYFDSRVSVVLVRAKSGVTPLKPLSVLRLELMACCIGAPRVNFILKALSMPDLKVTLWSDSTTTHWWIKDMEIGQFLTAKEIRELTQIKSWKWWEGPSWLKQNSEYWPDAEITCEPQEVKAERKKTRNANVHLANDALAFLICNVSEYDKMIRVFAGGF
ncbi:integrase catalytic domain-containing protein [Trichonephila clavipes]|nr:integrase catalytic domain-containing protein [Trichonephila clavipes]